MTGYVYIVATVQGPEAAYSDPALAVEHLLVHHAAGNPDRTMGSTKVSPGEAYSFTDALAEGALVMVTDVEEGLIVTAERHGIQTAVMPAEDIKLDDASKAVRVLEIVREFIAVQGITCAEAIYQTDRVAENALPLIEELADVVGYHEVDDAGDDE